MRVNPSLLKITHISKSSAVIYTSFNIILLNVAYLQRSSPGARERTKQSCTSERERKIQRDFLYRLSRTLRDSLPPETEVLQMQAECVLQL